jgi:hypothetical protein
MIPDANNAAASSRSKTAPSAIPTAAASRKATAARERSRKLELASNIQNQSESWLKRIERTRFDVVSTGRAVVKYEMRWTSVPTDLLDGTLQQIRETLEAKYQDVSVQAIPVDHPVGSYDVHVSLSDPEGAREPRERLAKAKKEAIAGSTLKFLRQAHATMRDGSVDCTFNWSTVSSGVVEGTVEAMKRKLSDLGYKGIVVTAELGDPTRFSNKWDLRVAFTQE